MREIIANQNLAIPLGRQGENNVTEVKFFVAEWETNYGHGEFTLLHQREGDTAPYACPITVLGDVVSWVVRNSDTAHTGAGKAELIYYVDEAVAKSVIYQTITFEAIDGDPVFPDPYDDWLRQMHDDAEYVREHYSEAIEAHYDAEAWAVGTRGGVEVDEEDPAYHNSSKYHAEQSAASATESEDSADRAEQSALEAASFVGSPLVASSVLSMTNINKIYVYVGSEVGYTYGNWYYHNGIAWVSGGVYNSIADDIAATSDIDTALYS